MRARAKTKWPSGVPVFQTMTDEVFVATGFQDGFFPWLIGYHPMDEVRSLVASWSLEAVSPLNADARAMLAIAREGR